MFHNSRDKNSPKSHTQLYTTMRSMGLVIGMVSTLAIAAFGITVMNPHSAAAAECGDAQTSIISCDAAKSGTAEANDSANNPIIAVLTYIMQILTGAVGIAAVGALIYAGILYSAAGGEAGQVQKAKTIITDTVIGIVCYAGMIIILNFIIPGGVFGQQSTKGGGTTTSSGSGTNNGSDTQSVHNNVTGSGSASSPTLLSYKKIADITWCHTQQGLTTDGSSLFLSCATQGKGVPTTIHQLRFNGTKIASSGSYALSVIGHANDMAYNSKTKTILVNRWDWGDKNAKSLLLIDATNINKTKGYATLSGKDSTSSANICYNAATDQYFANGVIYNNKFASVKVLAKPSKIQEDIGQNMDTGQGVECSSSYIYIIRATGTDGNGKLQSRLLVYDWSAKVIGVYSVNEELEGVAVANGHMYGTLNISNTLVEITNVPI